MSCIICGKDLTKDEIGITKKLINRGTTKFMCITCLSSYFNIEQQIIIDKIKLFKSQGCTLFN